MKLGHQCTGIGGSCHAAEERAKRRGERGGERERGGEGERGREREGRGGEREGGRGRERGGERERGGGRDRERERVCHFPRQLPIGAYVLLENLYLYS